MLFKQRTYKVIYVRKGACCRIVVGIDAYAPLTVRKMYYMDVISVLLTV
jgi:hypothetical protein